MAEFLETEEIVDRLHTIIKEAKEELVLISPFVRPDDKTCKLLEAKPPAIVRLVLLDGEQSEPDVRKFLDSLHKDSIRYREKLHSKCYLNENEAIVTSMNLLKSSQDNDEMGILVVKDHDTDLYQKIRDEAKRYVWEDKTAASQVAERGREYSTAPGYGFCIRCRTPVPAKPKAPYCRRHYANWKRYVDDDEYEEKHCHTCGKDHKAKMIKPVCPPCYKKYRSMLEFAVEGRRPARY